MRFRRSRPPQNPLRRGRPTSPSKGHSPRKRKGPPTPGPVRKRTPKRGTKPAQPKGKTQQTTKRHSPRSPQKPRSAQRPRNGEVTAYHGTPSPENARSVFRHGWVVGSGNAHGDGVYLATDIRTAKAYAGRSGVYLKCRVRTGRCATWNATLERQFQQWLRQRNVTADNSAKTAFLLQQGYHTLRSGDVIVVLQPQFANPTAWKQRTSRIRVLSAHDARGKRIRV
jgi:hypothetical protein